ncbi:nucleoside phosphorylase domain-containing protein [Hysterangium stoloniferum]|nr:nucleoside phosphorylase domain-containing protein [Hysterangium stoloniferum]
MKDTITDANFPRTADGRVYHLGIRAGEVANRIITVGPPSRARSIASLLSANPPPFSLESERGFLTITGLYNEVPISIVAIGMGAANADFFVREARECVTGDMVIVRLGSCGGLLDALPVGSIVIPKSSVSIIRNYDFDFTDPEAPDEAAYHISKPAPADTKLHDAVILFIFIISYICFSFYSSQGRQTSFPDHNSHLIDHLLSRINGLASLEMETFHILHLALSWSKLANAPSETDPLDMISSESSIPPVFHAPTAVTQIAQEAPTPTEHRHTIRSIIRAASVQMIFAARLSRDFITPEVVRETENWTGKTVLQALSQFQIEPEKLHPTRGSVWENR